MEQKNQVYDKTHYTDPGYHLLIEPEASACFPLSEMPCFHEDFEIKYVVSGTMNVAVDGVFYSLEKGDILIVHPYEFHSNVKIEGQDSTYHLFILNPDFFKEQGDGRLDLSVELLQKHRRFHTVIRNNEILGSLLRQAAEEETEHGAYWRDVISRYLETFFFLLLRSYTEDEKNASEHYGHFHACALIEPALREIHRNYGKPLSLGSLAAVCGLSAPYFSHMFREAVGKTPIAYCTEYRIRIAQRLLESTDTETQEAAKQCGFQDVNYFYRCYKKYVGISLRKRRAQQKTAEKQRS